MKSALYILTISLILFSCQKVIDVDLNEANANIVLEADYTAEDSTVRLSITETTSFFDSNSSPTIDNATATIQDHLGNTTPLVYIGSGQFELTNYIPNFNTSYTMNVNHNGILYQASCLLPDVVNLEPLTTEYFPSFFGFPDGYAVNLSFYDPAGVENYYLVHPIVNDTVWNELSDFILQDDLVTDGNLVERPLFMRRLFQTGDTITLEFRSVDEVVFRYYDQIQDILGAGQAAAAPANPDTNWDNKALGYFSAYGIDRKTVIVQ